VAIVAVLALLLGGCSGRNATKGAADAAARSSASSTPAGAAAPPSAGCDTKATKPAAGTASHTLAFSGADRTYLLHVPATYDGTKPVPIVFEFHGHGSSAAQQIVYGDFRPLAEREDFLVVAPDGQGSPRHFTYGAATPGGTEADDVAFATALLDHLETELCIDPTRVFATGMSNGGALSSVIACRAPDRFAAVAPVAAFFYFPGCAGAKGRPAPILAMMGTADPVVPYAGGKVNCCGNPTIPAAEDTMAKFAARSDCKEPFVEDRPSPSIRHRRWNGCAAGNAVELYAVEGGGHTWPGSPIKVGRLGGTTDELIATDVIWAFFAAHPLPRS
jgi:polyhydroxybutyrate depolymerase